MFYEVNLSVSESTEAIDSSIVVVVVASTSCAEKRDCDKSTRVQSIESDLGELLNRSSVSDFLGTQRLVLPLIIH